MASFKEMPSGNIRALIRRKQLGSICRTFKTNDEARTWAEGEEARMLRVVLEAPAASAGGITLRDAWNSYKISAPFNKKAPSTRKREGQAAIPVLRHLGGLSLPAIDRVRLQFYFDKRGQEKNLKGEKLAGDTLWREKELLSSIFRWAIRRGYAHTNPTKAELDMPECHVRESRISVEQEAKMYDAAFEFITPGRKGHPPNPCLFPWFIFIMATGTRPGESAKIELDWVHLKDREIHIPRASHKTRRPRIVLLTAAVVKMMKRQVEYAESKGSKYLFFSHGKKGIRPYAYSKPWRSICKRAGIPDDVVPHSGRREFISRMFERTNLSDSQIAMLVGDVHPLSLRPYTHLRANILRPQLSEFEAVMATLKTEYYREVQAVEEAQALLKKLKSTK